MGTQLKKKRKQNWASSRLECPPCLPPLNIHQSRTIQSRVENPSLQPSLQHPLRTFCFKSVLYLLTYLDTYREETMTPFPRWGNGNRRRPKNTCIKRDREKETLTAGFKFSWRKMDMVAAQDRAVWTQVVCGLAPPGATRIMSRKSSKKKTVFGLGSETGRRLLRVSDARTTDRRHCDCTSEFGAIYK